MPRSPGRASPGNPDNPASPGNVLRGVTVNLGAELAQKLGVPLELVAYAAAAASELGYRCKGEG